MNLVAKSLRYWHTLRHLKPVQFYGRLWIKLYRPQLAATPVTLPLRDDKGVGSNRQRASRQCLDLAALGF
ncbi:hypothetical protein [Candidatus Aalborgicola defluviihabitans]|uniref:hypothetical protein n=1 Tax=Candidatus Aalborgicola defluviihabitans TaxID=3386187 RepID=UPI0039B830C9